jgi:hypothetical protein
LVERDRAGFELLSDLELAEEEEEELLAQIAALLS